MTDSIKTIAERAKDRRAIPASFAVLPGGGLAEMIHDPDESKTRFAVWQNGQVRYEDRLQLGNDKLLRPYAPDNTLVQTEVVLFPSRADPYDSEPALVQELRAFIHGYVDLTPFFETLAAYYVLFSWVYDSFNELPYLRVKGDAGSGKTRFLMTVGSLCYKPIFASGASTVSPLFRTLDLFRGTLVIDEGDFRFSDEKAEVIKILNNGNARGFPVLRTEVVGNQREFSPRAYQVYGPKLVATRSLFQDRALESRCLTEELGNRRLRSDVPINLPAGFRAEARAIRNKLLMFRFANYGKAAADASLVDRSIEPRLNQVFVPLLSVIDDEQARRELREVLHGYQRQLVADRGLDAEAQVLEVIRDLHESVGDTDLPLRDITNHFIERHAQEVEHEITPKWVGGLIRKRLGLHTLRMRGGFVIPRAESPKLEQLYEKYGLAVDAEEPDNTSTPPEPPW
jgi:hypothetical protein